MATAVTSKVHHLPLTKARTNLGAVIRRVRINKDHFILEKDGIPVAAIVDVDEYEDLMELRDPGMKKQIAEGYAEYKRGETRPARNLIRELKAHTNRNRKRKRKS